MPLRLKYDRKCRLRSFGDWTSGCNARSGCRGAEAGIWTATAATQLFGLGSASATGCARCGCRNDITDSSDRTKVMSQTSKDGFHEAPRRSHWSCPPRTAAGRQVGHPNPRHPRQARRVPRRRPLARPGVRLRRPDQSLIVGAYRPPIVHSAGESRFHTFCMGKLVTFGVALCFASSTLAQPRDYLTSRPWIDQQREQFRKKQPDLQRRQRAEQQQQLNQERFRAEHGWQLHPRPQAPWGERRREDELRKEFHRRNLQLGRLSHCLCRHALVGLRVSSRSPPIDGTTRPIPRFDRSVSMDSSRPALLLGTWSAAVLAE